MNKYALAAILISSIFGSGFYLGYDYVNKQWDIDKAKRQAVFDNEKKNNEENLKSLKDKHQKEVEYAKSKAGMDYLDRWLREHGLLSSGIPVPGGSGKAEVPQGTDAGTCEPGTTERLRGFAGRCRDDARKVRMCKEWAEREHLETE